MRVVNDGGVGRMMHLNQHIFLLKLFKFSQANCTDFSVRENPYRSR